MGSDTNIIAASRARWRLVEYAIWKSGAELRRRDERHFTTIPAGGASPRPAPSPSTVPATSQSTGSQDR